MCECEGRDFSQGSSMINVKEMKNISWLGRRTYLAEGCLEKSGRDGSRKGSTSQDVESPK